MVLAQCVLSDVPINTDWFVCVCVRVHVCWCSHFPGVKTLVASTVRNPDTYKHFLEELGKYVDSQKGEDWTPWPLASKNFIVFH